MAQNITLYKILISCPGDVTEELDVIDEVVEQFNQQYTDPLGISIQTKHWSKSAYAQSGDKPQNLLNQQIVNDCDAAIAVLWSRFGTPTDRYGSGTEEEISIMLEQKKQVFMYFSDRPIEPSRIRPEQYDRVQKFRESYKDKGIYYGYQSIDDFRKLLLAHLSMYFLTQQRIEELENQRKPRLCVRSYYNGQLWDDFYVQEFSLKECLGVGEKIEQIKKLFQQIPQIKVGEKREIVRDVMSAPEIIDDNIKGYIQHMAEVLEIDLSENFFDLGGLRKDTMSLSLLGGHSQKGTAQEKEKYAKIYELRDKLGEALSCIKLLETYKDLCGMQLVLENEGTLYDEDIDVELAIPKDILMLHTELPVLDSDPFTNLEDIYSVDDLMTIGGTRLFADYESSCRKTKTGIGNFHPETFMLPGQKDYEEEYREQLDNAFDYEVYENGDEFIVRLHIDYIRQHAAVAFPTWLFVKNSGKNVSAIVKVKILSKNNPGVEEKNSRIIEG